mgnify:CR=1 FL=1
MAMHRALFAANTPDAAARARAAASVGVTIDSATVGAPAISEELDRNLRIARQLGFDGTPSWVIGDRVLSGAVGYDQLREAIAAARAKG